MKDKKGSGHRKKKRTTDDNRLAPPTVAKRVSVAKQVFRAAVRWGWITTSPFDGLRPGSQANPARARYVPLAARKSVNLRTHLERIIAKAGHEPWPRLVQNLRASCEPTGSRSTRRTWSRSGSGTRRRWPSTT